MSQIFDWLKNKYRKLDQATQPIQNRVVSQIKQNLPTPTNFRNQVVKPIQQKVVQPIKTNYIQPARQQYPTLAKMSDFSTKLNNAPRKLTVDYLRSQVRNPISLISRQTFTPTTRTEKLLLGNEPVVPAEKSWGAKKTGIPAVGVDLL